MSDYPNFIIGLEQEKDVKFKIHSKKENVILWEL